MIPPCARPNLSSSGWSSSRSAPRSRSVSGLAHAAHRAAEADRRRDRRPRPRGRRRLAGDRHGAHPALRHRRAGRPSSAATRRAAAYACGDAARRALADADRRPRGVVHAGRRRATTAASRVCTAQGRDLSEAMVRGGHAHRAAPAQPGPLRRGRARGPRGQARPVGRPLRAAGGLAARAYAVSRVVLIEQRGSGGALPPRLRGGLGWGHTVGTFTLRRRCSIRQGAAS